MTLRKIINLIKDLPKEYLDLPLFSNTECAHILDIELCKRPDCLEMYIYTTDDKNSDN